jgi:drug/metabolite transporter (DMT)-like permease
MPYLPSQKPALGIILLVLAMLIVPIMDATAKFLSSEYPVLQLVWARFFFHFLLIAPLALWRHGSNALFPEKPLLQISRGFLILLCTACFWGSIKFIPLANAIAILFFDAVIVVGLSVLILKEQVPKNRWFASWLGLVAVLMIVRPGFEEFHWASLLALAASIFFALYILSTRFLAGKALPLVTLSYQSLGGFVIMTAIVPFVWVTPTQTDLILMIAMALIGAAGHLLLIRAFEFAEASLLAPYLYTEMIMQAVLGYWFFGDLPDTWAWVGILLIISVGIFLSFASKETQNPNGKRV